MHLFARFFILFDFEKPIDIIILILFAAIGFAHQDGINGIVAVGEHY